MDICISLDTTGSMYPCLAEAKRRLRETLARLFREIPDLRVSVVVHGDYCDKRTTYVVGYLDFTNDLDALDHFVSTAGKTGGGDNPECYEYVMGTVATLSWKSSTRVYILVGDDVPHIHKHEFTNGYQYRDWRKEAGWLVREHGITIHAVQCLNRKHATPFYSELAQIGQGAHLSLDQFSNIIELITATAYQQVGEEALLSYEQELRDDLRLNRGLARIFDTLMGRKDSSASSMYGAADLESVPAGRFQVLHVDKDMGIREFVLSTGAEFRVGRGFYELRKRELVQEKKEVVLEHKISGDMFTGARARTMIGLPYGSRGYVDRYSPASETYNVFIQSTSWNRNLVRNTRFLYEVE